VGVEDVLLLLAHLEQLKNFLEARGVEQEEFLFAL
jgi:hypothetical protein